MTTQETIVRACDHTTALEYVSSAVVLVGGGTVHCCCACWNAAVHAGRATRKRELADWRAANLPDCERCGRAHAGNWQLAQYHLCGRCKRAVLTEHYHNLAEAGQLAVFATGLLVDTTAWYKEKK